jgi:hypothetical protein
MTVPVEIHVDAENRNYRMFLQKTDNNMNIIQSDSNLQVSLKKIFQTLKCV